MDLVRFIFVEHFTLACVAALWFLGGVLLCIPVLRWGIRWPQRLSVWIFRHILRLFGDQPSLLRITMTIFLFNGTAMFLYMSMGVHPLIPQIIALATGFNIAVFFVRSGELEPLLDARAPSTAQWIPSPALTVLCGALVILLELPCFWYSIGMGIKLGHIASTNLQDYAEAFFERGRAYGGVIIPVLFISAICESIAIRGAGALAQIKERSAEREDEEGS